MSNIMNLLKQPTHNLLEEKKKSSRRLMIGNLNAKSINHESLINITFQLDSKGKEYMFIEV